MKPSSPRILIYGAGAVGSLAGGLAAAAGADVVLLGRERVLAPVAADGLAVEVGALSRRVRPQVTYNLSEAAAGGVDLVILAIKAHGTDDAARDIQAAWPDPSRRPPVLTLQNGVGNEERLARLLGEKQVLSAALTVAVSCPVPGKVAVEGGKGGLAIGGNIDVGNEARSALAALREGFRSAGLPAVRIDGGYRELKWSKLLLNILGNATCAILDMLPAKALADGAVFRLERAAFREGLQVMRVMGITVRDLPGYPVRLLSRVMDLPAPVAHRLLYRPMAGGRGGKPPSFLLDVRAGRPTEVAFLNGAVAAAGRELGVSTPVNAALTACLEGISRGDFPRDDFRGRPARLLDFIRSFSS